MIEPVIIHGDDCTATLYCGDCMDVLPTLAAGSVDAVVTDPPYGMNWNTDSTRFSGGVNPDARYGVGRKDWGDIVSDDKPFDPAPWLSFERVVFWGANHYAARLPLGTTLVWLKKPDHMFGKFLSDAEIGWMKGGYGVYCFRKQFPAPSRIHEGNGKVLHPTQKPISLMHWCIERCGIQRGATILDPFMGSGTTGVAAMKLGRSFIGVEIEPRYFEIAVKRIREAAMQPALFRE